ncbi:hypothetical protein CTAYLR_006901 [Chrysophaeum taylorii]|uniref:Glutamate/phenylalanine/leucine/valine/L-tryptophan dehydrogenase C-terminal domain-containing protein n=1 Tax=Chrysophaeum taylorii TaxID=2483200 RepID=A0AAD7UFZ5_9STRA|nr:hypothetical protein CTAYLR_006901 [Chrysophaeum taylorii]
MHEYTQMQLKMAERLVPWFLDQMPASYFRSVSEADRLQHLRAISALHSHEGEDELRVVTSTEDERVVTIARTGNRPGVLLRQVQQLTHEPGRLSQVKVFTSRDESLCLNVFVFDTKPEARKASGDDALRNAALWAPHESYAAKLMGEAGFDNLAAAQFFGPDAVREYLARCPASYLAKVRPMRLWQQRELWERARYGEHVKAQLVRASPVNDDVEERGWWIQIAAPSIRPRGFLRRILRALNASELSIERCHLDVIDGVAMIRVLVVTPDGEKWADDDTSEGWRDVLHAIERIKWLSDQTIDLALATGPQPPSHLELVRAEAKTALCALAHSRLAASDAIAYSRSAVAETVAHSRYKSIARDAAELALHRSSPDLCDEGCGLVEDPVLLKERIKGATAGVDNAAKRILDALVDVATSVETSNASPDKPRCALAFALNPAKFLRAGSTTSSDHDDDEGDPSPAASKSNNNNNNNNDAMPYSIIFSHGRRFDGYHVRFRKIARGGMRLVTPRTPEAISWEASRHFDECFNLAFAQQLKNKDIPEGGSKAVLLLDTLTPDGREDYDDDVLVDETVTLKHYACRQAVKAFTDSILDLALATNDMIYLGPDEQILPEDIEWVVGNAELRGHPVPDAFMSSKPDAGINHKTYGVTSEGVVVFVEQALNSIGRNPRDEPFTIKLTGGPDGDVAGNMLKFLFRDFGDNVRVVGVADGSGCAEDPAGLDRAELERLVSVELPVSNFDPNLLSPSGAIHDAQTDDGAAMRDSMHARVQADVFVPAGGRPATLNAQNVDAFFGKDGRPSSTIVVEGANLFLTPEARKALYRRGGVRVVKDSSANKCGVVCSSLEILCAHVLDRSEFEAFKPAIVAEIIQKLRHLACLEAKLLFREMAHYPGDLPEFSTRISHCITTIKDHLIDHFDGSRADAAFDTDTPVLTLFKKLAPDHLPPTLATFAVDRAHRLPTGYVAAACASFVASRLVYAEGINFCETLPKDRLAQIALDFVEAQHNTQKVVEAVKTADGLDDVNRDVIVRLLDRGGARASLDL